MIEINQTSLVVRNVKDGSAAMKQIDAKYSFFDKVCHKYTFSIFTKIGDDLYFPASIGTTSLKKIFPEKEVQENTITPHKIATISYSMKNHPRNDLQKKALAFLMTMKKPEEMKQRLISLPTGSGKTFVTIAAIQQFKLKPLIVVDKVALAEQWKEQFLFHTDLKPEEICILSGNESVEYCKKHDPGKVYIAIHRTLGNMLSDDSNAVNILMSKLKIGIRIFDESHVEFKNICNINSFSNVRYTIYLTATPHRSQFAENKLYERVFKSIPYFDGRSMATGNYHTVVLVKMDSKPDIATQGSIRTKYGFSSPKWARYIEEDGYDNFYENLDLIISKLKLIERGMKTAIVLPTINLIKKVEHDLLRDHPELSLGVFIGEMKGDKRSTALEKTFILTNDKMFDKAIDVPGLEILINYVQFASSVKNEQLIGRLRYQPGKIAMMVDVGDIGFTETYRQFKIRKRFYKKYAKSITEIN